MIRSVQLILCVEKSWPKADRTPFSRHKQITSPQISYKRRYFEPGFLDTQAIPGAMFGFEQTLYKTPLCELRTFPLSPSESEKMILKHIHHKMLFYFENVSRKQARNYNICSK